MVDLKEFVTSTLTQIIEGVQEAQRKQPEFVNPKSRRMLPQGDTLGGAYATTTDLVARLIEFDIAVTAEKSSTTEGGVRVAVMGLGAGAAGEVINQQSTASRIKFEVPLALPRSGKDE